MFFSKLLNSRMRDEISDVKNPSPWLRRLFSNESSSGERVTVNSALGIPTVYRCVNIKANTVAMLPFQTFRRTEGGRERDREHAVAKLLEIRPNPYQSPFQFKHLIETHRNTWGNAYVNIVWNERGQPVELWLLDPSQTEPIIDLKTNFLWYVTTLPNGTQAKIPYHDIIHLKALTTDGIKGKPPIQVAREAIGSSQAAQKFKGNFYKHGAANSGFLKIPEMLNREAKEVIREEWEQANTGLSNAQRIAILDAGLEFQSVTMPLRDAQFVEAMQFDKIEIATMFDIPPHMVGDLERATHSNIEQENLSFLQNTINPVLVQYQEEFRNKLFSSREASRYYLNFNLDMILRADTKTRGEFYQMMLDKGVYSINEVRELEERNAIEGGDQHRVDLNHVSLEIANEYQLARVGISEGGEENKE